MEDPFFVVRDEVSNALQKARNLYDRWIELNDDILCGTKDELDWTTTELRNALRSIEWDLEDLEETIGIVEGNPKKFRIEEQDIAKRRLFISETQKEVSVMRDKLFDSKVKTEKRTTMATLMNNPALTFGSNVGNVSGAKYSKLQNVSESPVKNVSDEHCIQIEKNIRHQDDPNDMNNGVGALKEISRAMHKEIDEQQDMLDGFNNGDIQVVNSRFDTAFKKVAKVLHLNDGNRQWTAIGILTTIVVLMVVGIIAF